MKVVQVRHEWLRSPGFWTVLFLSYAANIFTLPLWLGALTGLLLAVSDIEPQSYFLSSLALHTIPYVPIAAGIFSGPCASFAFRRRKFGMAIFWVLLPYAIAILEFELIASMTPRTTGP